MTMTNNNNERVKNQFRISNWSQRTSNTAENTEFEEIDLKFTQMLHVQITSSIFLEFRALLLACALHVAEKMQTTDFMMIVNCENKHSIWKVLFTHAKKRSFNIENWFLFTFNNWNSATATLLWCTFASTLSTVYSAAWNEKLENST